MTFFESCYNGTMGEYWKKNAINQIAEFVKDYENGEMAFDEDGAVKWVSSGAYFFDDLIEVMSYTGIRFNAEATRIKRRAQVAELLSHVEDTPVSDEERYEMTAAFGKGTTVVNVLTGRTITL